MKKINLILICSLVSVFGLKAQQPCTDAISTDYCTNPARPSPALISTAVFKTNAFDWTYNDASCPGSSSYISVPYSVTNPPPYFIPVTAYPATVCSSADMADLHNPYYHFDRNPFYIQEKAQTSDMYPEDGWELIKRDYGFVSNGTNPYNFKVDNVNYPPNIPYTILYNRYTGKLRIWGNLWGNTGLATYQTMRVHLWLFSKDNPILIDPTNENYPSGQIKSGLKLSGLFNTYHNDANGVSYTSALDQGTDVYHIIADALMPDDGRTMFFADFQMGYDVCTCLFESNIDISFESITKGNIILNGRAVGYSTNLSLEDGSSYGMYGMNLGNFLNSYTTNSATDSLSAGNLMVADINTLQSVVDAESSLTDFQTFLHTVTPYIGTIGSFLSSYFQVNKPGGSATLNDNYSTTSHAGSALAASSSFLSAILSVTDNNNNPNTSFTYSSMQMTMKGIMETDKMNHDYDLIIANPGCANSDNYPEIASKSAGVVVPAYTPYNNVLGVMALLNTPNLRSNWNINATFPQGCVNPGIGGLPYNFTNYTQVYKLRDPLQIAFNDALHINHNGSKLMATIEVTYIDTLHGAVPSNYYCASSLPLGYSYNNMILVSHVGSQYTCSSPMVPLEYLTSIAPSITYNGFSSTDLYYYFGGVNPFIIKNVVVKIYLSGISNNISKSGFPNTFQYLATYKPNLLLDNTLNYRNELNVPTDITIDNSSTLFAYPHTLTPNQTIYAWTGVNINTYIYGTNVTIIAPSINVNPGGKVYPGITLKTGFPCGYVAPNWPVSRDAVTTFCNSTLYKANSPAGGSTDLAFGGNKNISFMALKTTAKLVPNPAIDASALYYYVPDDNTSVNITITDLTGNHIVLFDGIVAKGSNTLQINTGQLSAGMYIVGIKTDKSFADLKLIVTHN